MDFAAFGREGVGLLALVGGQGCSFVPRTMAQAGGKFATE